MAFPKTGLHTLAENEANKYVGINTNSQALDALIQPTVKSMALSAPPGSPANGDTYIVLATGTGAWAGHDKQIAYYATNAWAFYAPTEGWQVYDQNTDTIYVYLGSAWGPLIDQLIPTTTFSSLNPAKGKRANITDATTPTWGATAVGGGAVFAPVYYDGATWKFG